MREKWLQRMVGILRGGGYVRFTNNRYSRGIAGVNCVYCKIDLLKNQCPGKGLPGEGFDGIGDREWTNMVFFCACSATDLSQQILFSIYF